MAAPPPAFPRAAARLYLQAAQPSLPALPGLTLAGAAPSAARAAAAEARLRQLADSSTEGAAAERQQALASMVLGIGEGYKGQIQTAERDLTAAAAFEPIRDAATEALTRFTAPKDAAATLTAADRYPIAKDDIFYRTIALRAATAAMQLNDYTHVDAWTAELPHTAQVLWLEAQAAEGERQARRAGELERALIYTYPASPEAALAESHWQAALASMPDLSADRSWIERQADGWAAAGRARNAAEDWMQAAAMAPAQDHDRLRMYAAREWLRAGDRTQAESLDEELLRGPERAQAMEFGIELARQQRDPAGLDAPVEEMERAFPASDWYARALHEAGDEALIDGATVWAERYFERLSERFPHSGYGPNAAWQAAWAAYRLHSKETPRLLEHVLIEYPQSGLAVDALYWRGEWARTHGEPKTAAACFQAAANRYPGTYFGMEAKKLAPKRASRLRISWLRPFANDPSTPRAAPPPARYSSEIERAEWMREAGLDNAAAAVMEGVLRKLPAGADALGLARRLAELDAERQDWHQGMDAMLHAVPDYLALERTQLTAADWKRLFPLAFAGDVTVAARQTRVPRNLLLGVIRQESGFDSNSVSNARAQGLMQLEYSTAALEFRRLPAEWRKLTGDRLQSSDLLNPGLSVGLGASTLAGLLRKYRDPALALAAYNAGAARLDAWQAMFGRLPRDEFIETIPFAQTRAYVQGVLRNQMHYDQIYTDRDLP